MSSHLRTNFSVLQPVQISCTDSCVRSKCVCLWHSRLSADLGRALLGFESAIESNLLRNRLVFPSRFFSLPLCAFPLPPSSVPVMSSSEFLHANDPLMISSSEPPILSDAEASIARFPRMRASPTHTPHIAAEDSSAARDTIISTETLRVQDGLTTTVNNQVHDHAARSGQSPPPPTRRPQCAQGRLRHTLRPPSPLHSRLQRAQHRPGAPPVHPPCPPCRACGWAPPERPRARPMSALL